MPVGESAVFERLVGREAQELQEPSLNRILDAEFLPRRGGLGNIAVYSLGPNLGSESAGWKFNRLSSA